MALGVAFAMALVACQSSQVAQTPSDPEISPIPVPASSSAPVADVPAEAGSAAASQSLTEKEPVQPARAERPRSISLSDSDLTKFVREHGLPEHHARKARPAPVVARNSRAQASRVKKRPTLRRGVLAIKTSKSRVSDSSVRITCTLENTSDHEIDYWRLGAYFKQSGGKSIGHDYASGSKLPPRTEVSFDFIVWHKNTVERHDVPTCKPYIETIKVLDDNGRRVEAKQFFSLRFTRL